jgi:hypothetical protein
LYRASQAFVSHSRRDSATAKYTALQAWRERFIKANGREPTVWLDRCCLDPRESAQLLVCLPIYCSSCDQLLALRGPTFLDRLWCARGLLALAPVLAQSASRGANETRPRPSRDRALAEAATLHARPRALAHPLWPAGRPWRAGV